MSDHLGVTLLGRGTALAMVAGLAAVPLAALTVGRPGALAALLAVGLVLGFLLVGQIPVTQVARGRRRVGAALLVILYVLRVLLLLVAFRVFYVADDVDHRVLGLTIIACALAWTGGTVWSALRWRPMVVEPEPPSRSAASRAAQPR